MMGVEYNSKGQRVTWRVRVRVWENRWKKRQVEGEEEYTTADEAKEAMEEHMSSGLLIHGELWRCIEIADKRAEFAENRAKMERICTIECNKKGEMTNFERTE